MAVRADAGDPARAVTRTGAIRSPMPAAAPVRDWLAVNHGVRSYGETVEFHGVHVVAESQLALCCHIMRRDHWIAPHRLLEGSVARFGDRGMVIVARQFAEDQGLLLSRSPPLR